MTRFKLFFEELGEYNYRELPNGTFEIDDENHQSINDLASKHQYKSNL